MKAFTLIEAVTSLAIIVMLVVLLALPYYRAKHYNDLTGAHISYWDALFVDLRIEEPIKK